MKYILSSTLALLTVLISPSSAQDIRNFPSELEPILITAGDDHMLIAHGFRAWGTGIDTMVSISVGLMRGQRSLIGVYQVQCATGLSRIVYIKGENLDTGVPIDFFSEGGTFAETPEIFQDAVRVRCARAMR